MTFPPEIKEDVIQIQRGYCDSIGCYSKIHSIHHKLPNHKANQKKYPNFIHSIFNAIGLCEECHTNHYYNYRVNPEAAEVYEKYIAMWLGKEKAPVNDQEGDLEYIDRMRQSLSHVA